MKLNCVRVCCTLALAVAAAACQKSSPTRPSDTTAATDTQAVTDAVTGITMVSPSLQSPADAAQLKFTDQPLVLTTKNAVTTGKAALTYTFQVASDPAFASVVFSQAGVAQGSGTTSLTISKLAGAKTYFWRAMATSGSTNSLPSKARSFIVGPEIVIQAPTPSAPQNNGTANGTSPTLTTSNATVTGPAGAITYKFEIA